MTTIAANKTTIACDLQYNYGHHQKFKGNTKIYKMDHPACKEFFGSSYAYMGLSGDVKNWGQIIAWLSDPSNGVPKIKRVEMLVLTSNGDILQSDNLRDWIEIKDPYFAIGSGMQFALAAMTTGETPLDAVKIASKHDIYTGMGFKEYNI